MMLNVPLEAISYYVTVAGFWCFNRVPLSLRLKLARGIVKAFALVSPSFTRTSLRNLELVFPEYTERQHHQLHCAAQQSLARFIVDSIRFHELDGAWVHSHIECPFNERYLAIKEGAAGRGILTASAHLGSIELQALAAPFMDRKFSFVARSLKHKKLDRWWLSKRQLFGNEVIPRKGAVSKIVENLNNGTDVAILIDQNVRQQYALFVDWFGRRAATTFALGHAAVKTECPVVVSAIRYIGAERYRVDEHEIDVQSIYRNTELTFDDKVLAVTQLASVELQKLILASPSEWFWMHRRWKTTPPGEPEDFYVDRDPSFQAKISLEHIIQR